MGDLGGSEPATDLFDQWLAHHEGRALEPDRAPTELPESTEQIEQFEQAADPEPVETRTDPETDPETEPAPERVEQSSHRPTHLAATDPAAATDLPDQHLAAASVVAELAAVVPQQPEATTPERRPVLPHTIFFKPRRGTERLLGVLLVLFLALTAAAAVWAWSDRTYLSYGVAGVLAVLTAIVWATRTGASPTRLTLRGSELEIIRNGSRALFDLAGPQTVIEMRGEPGERRWKVLIQRRSMSPYVIDGSMVDPGEMTQVLRYFRPEI
ncbi:hypothetical protein P5P86_19640 [Nocardioides sp. BP30]|uniref:hypothetical protein n=1 Tax=Nocardioides sp. BP30 TaxID=3036374 RepID=UPI002468DBD4|nr:hypothetical protein [Nocardioides sp. BP30]WGL52151.1 hypothetical protein P5P86_19640 [Nocardioides sp. BP30]